jgi:hypothetical protein
MNGVHSGNARKDGRKYRGWLVGSFRPKGSPLFDSKIEIKWDRVKAGTKRTREQASVDPTRRTLQLVISVYIRTSFPATEDQEEGQEDLRGGDYCLWEAGVLHYWEAIKNSLVITIRWPSTW